MHIYKYPPIIIQFIGGFLIWIFFLLFTKLVFEGLENVENIRGRVIFASNHQSEWDGPLVRIGLPFFWRNSPMYYVALSKEWYPKERFGWRSYIYGGFIFQLAGAYPIYKGKRDYEISLKNHLKILEMDMPVCIFPEGKMTKTGEINPARGGVTYLSYKTKAPIVPVRIDGLHNISIKDFLFKRKKVTVKYNKPITHKELFENQDINIEDFKKKAGLVMDRLER